MPTVNWKNLSPACVSVGSTAKKLLAGVDAGLPSLFSTGVGMNLGLLSLMS
jgi:hypothetical protein